MPKTAKDYLDCESKLETDQAFWKTQWQLTAEYVHQRRADFTATRAPGAFISSSIWSDDPSHMAETSSSALLGYMWSAAEKSFKLVGNPKVFGKEADMREFWADSTDTLQREMGDPEAGLAINLPEIMLDLIVFGTSALLVEERNKDKPMHGCLSFDGWSILEFALDENGVGRADRFYRRREYNVRQCVEKYGIDNVSKRTRDLYNTKKYDEKVTVLHVIEPRDPSERKKSAAAKDMPIASVHVEVDAKHICMQSGYPELPIACVRLAKRQREKYGRGRAMNALPSIMMLNQIMEDLALCFEKKLDPPMYMINDSVVGNGKIDDSAGAVTVLKVDKSMPNVPPVGKLYDIQDPTDALELVQKLVETIGNHFMIDRLINLNNDVQMTKGEAFLRNSIRQSTLRDMVSRLITELFDPIINVCFMICLRRGKFGFMPNDPMAIALQRQGKNVKFLPDKIVAAMRDGEDLFSIEYMTPAIRDQLSEEAQGMVDTIEMAGALAKFDRTIPAYLDPLYTLSRMAEIRGASNKMFRKESVVKEQLAQQQQQEQQQQQLQLAMMQAGVAKDTATAQNTATQ